MDTMISEFITKEVDKLMANNMDTIALALNDHIDQTEQISKNNALLAINTIRTSSIITITYILDLLQKAEVIEIDEERLRKLSLKLLD